jgi:SAM-dependent methyltransferase
MLQNYTDDIYESDKLQTIRNHEKMGKNKILLYWYNKLYETQFEGIENIEKKAVLEIGSGTSPLKYFFSNVMTSDVLNLNYLDYHFNAHEIHLYEKIKDKSLDIITITNVLHHLKNPIGFLINAEKKLKSGGKIIITEPYFSFISSFIYKYIHPETVDFKIKEPVLSEVKGPLHSSNIALPYLIFFVKSNWNKDLKKYYNYSLAGIKYYTSISYFVTGGISRKFPIPLFLFKLILKIDIFFSKLIPKFFASFFNIVLIKR